MPRTRQERASFVGLGLGIVLAAVTGGLALGFESDGTLGASRADPLAIEHRHAEADRSPAASGQAPGRADTHRSDENGISAGVRESIRDASRRALNGALRDCVSCRAR